MTIKVIRKEVADLRRRSSTKTHVAPVQAKEKWLDPDYAVQPCLAINKI